MLGWLKRQLLAIRTWLLVINLVVVLVPVVGIEWARLHERELLRALEANMRNQAQLLRTVLEKTGTLADEADDEALATLQQLLRVAARRTRMRMRVLDRRGRVVADSHRHGPPEGPEPPVPRLWGTDYAPQRRNPGHTDPGPLSGRREVRAALRGELGTATRVHSRIQRVYLFVAMPVMSQRRVKGAVYVTRSTVPVLQSLYRLRTRLIQVLAGAIGFTALLTLFLAATISRPLTRLTRAAKRIAGGDRTESLRLHRADEIGQLARAFDALVQQLDARARYISEFAANISHEFKTPLSSIRGAAELLVDGAADDPGARRRFLENILADTRRLDRLVSRLLELSRIEATLEQREDLDLAQLVREAAKQLRAGESRIDLRGADAPLLLRGNRGHLQAAVCALIENALQHSPPDRSIQVELLRDEPRFVSLRVADSGDGISQANQKKIFDRFFTTRAGEGGTGLGLAIVSTVTQAHGGQVSVDSALGRGSRFTVRLPLSPPAST